MASGAKKPEFNANVFTRAIKHLHTVGKYDPEMLSDEPFIAVVNEANRVLSLALDEGIRDNIPPEAMLKKLREDVFVFSGYKTHAELKEAASLLLTADGKIRPFQDFRRDVWQVHQSYNTQYLEAEYIFATSSAQMASKWADFEKDGDRYNLQYRTAGDNRVRDEHAALANTTLPIEDPFWNSYLPPLGWRCRCTAVQVRKGKYDESNSEKAIAEGEKATTKIDKKGNNSTEIFRYNPGKDKVIFPPHHPYRKVQDGVKKIIENLQGTSEFIALKEYKNGGSINVHGLVDRNSHDYSDILKSCDHFAAKGQKAEVLPKLHPKSEDYKRVYHDLLGTKYERKSPDFRVNGKYYEFESFSGSFSVKKIRKMISRGKDQASRVVIDNTGGASDHYIMHTLHNRLKKGQDIEELWVYEKGSIRQLYKKQ